MELDDSEDRSDGVDFEVGCTEDAQGSCRWHRAIQELNTGMTSTRTQLQQFLSMFATSGMSSKRRMGGRLDAPHARLVCPHR